MLTSNNNQYFCFEIFNQSEKATDIEFHNLIQPIRKWYLISDWMKFLKQNTLIII
jgi:hypothetical protein